MPIFILFKYLFVNKDKKLIFVQQLTTNNMELQSAHRQGLLDTLKDTINESNELRKVLAQMIKNGNNPDTIMRTEIQLHLLILKIGMIETILIENQIDL